MSGDEVLGQAAHRHTESNTEYLFPPSGVTKRVFVRGVRAYGRRLRQSFELLTPPGDAETRILIQTVGGMGNSLMATPLIAAARALYPAARIDVLTTPGAAKLLAHDPNADEIFADTALDGGGMAEDVRVVRRVRAARYDAGLAAVNAHLVRSTCRLVFGRIPRRVIHRYALRAHDDFLPAFNAVVERPRDQHDVQCNLDLLRRLSGVDVEGGPLVLRLPPAALKAAETRLREAGWSPEPPLVALCPGSSGWMSFKRWPPERYLELARRLRGEHPDLQVLAILGPEEAGEATQWQEMARETGTIVMSGAPLLEALSMLSNVDVAVTNDNLFMHVCAALQRPVVALFGPTHARNTGPWKCPAHVVEPDGPYEPFFSVPYHLHPGQFPNYMARIPVEKVYDAVCGFLSSPRAARVVRDNEN